MNELHGKIINEVAYECYQRAYKSGWHEGDHERSILDRVAAFTANTHAEVSELWEAARSGKLEDLCDKAEKMAEYELMPLTCMEEELADIVIRAFDFSTSIGVDIGSAIARKMSYNATRPHRHGGKLA